MPDSLYHGCNICPLTKKPTQVGTSHTPTYWKHTLRVHSFKKKRKCNKTTIPLKKAWSQTNHGNSTPTRSGFENSLPSAMKRDAHFLPNILTSKNSSNRLKKTVLSTCFLDNLNNLQFFKKKSANMFQLVYHCDTCTCLPSHPSPYCCSSSFMGESDNTSSFAKMVFSSNNVSRLFNPAAKPSCTKQWSKCVTDRKTYAKSLFLNDPTPSLCKRVICLDCLTDTTRGWYLASLTRLALNPS